MTDHQQNQIKVVNIVEAQVNANSLQFSTVSPVQDFQNDPRKCLTGVHLPTRSLKEEIQSNIINPLKAISPEFYYYSSDSLHLTIKNVRVINDPPHFNEQDIEKAKSVFNNVIPKHNAFKVHFYRLLLFPNNLALIGTTDSELDNIILDLDKGLTNVSVADDKKYANSKYFFCNMTLARFSHKLGQEFIDKVNKLSASINIAPYTIDSVSLITCNAVLNDLQIIDTWKVA